MFDRVIATDSTFQLCHQCTNVTLWERFRFRSFSPRCNFWSINNFFFVTKKQNILVRKRIKVKRTFLIRCFLFLFKPYIEIDCAQKLIYFTSLVAFYVHVRLTELIIRVLTKVVILLCFVASSDYSYDAPASQPGDHHHRHHPGIRFFVFIIWIDDINSELRWWTHCSLKTDPTEQKTFQKISPHLVSFTFERE